MSGVETTIAELEKTLETMADENTTLEESISLYAKAAELVKSAHEKLCAAQVKIEEIDTVMEQMRLDDDL